MAPPALPATPRDHPQVVLVTGYNCPPVDLVCQPFKEALRRTGVVGRVLSFDRREDLVATVSLLARQRPDLILIFPDFPSNIALQVATKFPETQFVFLEPQQPLPRRSDNVQGLFIRTHEAAYLAGWLAGRLEQRRPGPDVVGVVGGVKIRAVEDFIVGFRAGARRGAPGVTVLTGYSQDFVDARKCEAIARRQIERGAGAIFNVAGGCGLGALRAARREHVWGIGVDLDQSGLGPHILTSVLKSYGDVFATLMRELRAGRIRHGATRTFSLRGGSAGLGRISPRVPAALRAELDAVRRQIIQGKITVPGVAPA